MDEITWTVNSKEDLTHDRVIMQYGFNERVYVPEKKGKWILTIEDWNRWTCSECGFSKRTDIHVSLGYDYCPSCGAHMMGVEINELDNTI